MINIYNATAINLGGAWWVIILVIWDLAWKGMGMWKAAKKGDRNWFIAMLVFNTVGILPIVYINFFHKKAK